MKGRAIRRFASACLALAALAFIMLVPGGALAQGSLAGKIIALDAGHGGDEWGATYPANAAGSSALIKEKDVNLEVVLALRDKLVAAGAQVALTRDEDVTISSRRERVDIALAECERLAGRKCDVLVSVHHNGSTDPSYDGLLVIYNEKQDLSLAKAVHDALLDMTYPPGGACSPYGWVDEGLRKGGYGMTVYGNLVSIITEAWYVTNDCEGKYYLAKAQARIGEETDALYKGLVAYFTPGGAKKGR